MEKEDKRDGGAHVFTLIACLSGLIDTVVLDQMDLLSCESVLL